MSRLVSRHESINKVLDNKEISKDEAYDIYKISEYDYLELFKTAQILRKKFKGSTVTFSKKVFFNLINLCRDTCSYCTYKSEPGETKLSMLSKDDITNLAKVGKKYRCTEALFVTRS